MTKKKREDGFLTSAKLIVELSQQEDINSNTVLALLESLQKKELVQIILRLLSLDDEHRRDYASLVKELEELESELNKLKKTKSK